MSNINKIKSELEKYIPYNEQEIVDRKLMLEYIDKFDDILSRNNTLCHFTASAWTVNKDKTKVLMAYHNIYDSWAWLGGHADGEDDMLEVAIREVKEESSVKNVTPLEDSIFSLEILGVDSHFKRGKFVSSHVHLNVTYLLEVDEKEEVKIKEDENSAVKWVLINDAVSLSTESNMQIIYQKIIDKFKEKYK